ncbi:hypothetical protein Taro_004754 [Colocasia esculenta]|uniref:Uncharacterized protein n=1 Tax=Colocasia esculenta TaxID=4460 RepID=A0A843TSK6_COLES|nr:hypothetical protein [Colocasia esculenta]
MPAHSSPVAARDGGGQNHFPRGAVAGRNPRRRLAAGGAARSREGGHPGQERRTMGGGGREDPAVDGGEGDRQQEQSTSKRRGGDGKGEKKRKKKRRETVKGEGEGEREADGGAGEEAAASSAVTVSIAVAGSIVDNAQSLELATLLAGQIARAATIFRIHEVIVFDNKSSLADDSSAATAENSDDNETGAPFLAKILHYLETPQYLRRSLFPMHNSLRFVGLLPPLDAPHHVRKHEWSPFREGVTLEERPLHSSGTLVNVGLSKNVMVEQILEPGVRVTISMGTSRALGTDGLKQVVTPFTPQEEMGLYWGYKVRYASNISSVFKNCPFQGGYDYIIGTSERGLSISSSELVLPMFRHLLIAFGGLGGLEECIEEDRNMKVQSI